MMRCEKCETGIGHLTRLFGGYVTQLCNSCVNAWHTLLDQDKHWTEDILECDVLADYYRNKHDISLAEWQDLHGNKRELGYYFRELAQEWLAQKGESNE